MREEIVNELQEQGRGVIGALVVVGISFLHTMEAWWLGWQLPVATLLAYALLGLALVLAITRNVGFREEQKQEQQSQIDVFRIVTDFSELVLQSFITAYFVWLLLGIIEIGDPPLTIARLGLILVVPLSFGAALANKLFTGTGDESRKELQFPKNVAIFALGSLFIVAPISLTEEMELIAAHAGWWRLVALVAVSVSVAYLTLYELEFQGQQRRIGDRSQLIVIGSSFLVYLVAALVSIGLLASFGHFTSTPMSVWVQEIIVLSFPGTIGASASQIVLG